MVTTRRSGVVFSCLCLLATTGWAAAASPSLIATPPQPQWSDLKVQQKIVLAALSDDWDSLEYYRQKKWLRIVARFPSMTPEEQFRIQGQMQMWGKLTPEQRQLAREKFKTTNRLPTEERQAFKKKWQEYSSLPPEEKEKFKQQSANKPVPKPGLPAAAVVPAPLAIPASRQMAVETTDPGASTPTTARR